MKVSDFIATFLEINGVEYAFGMSGGAILHLVDSLYNTTGITVLSGSHEQLSAFEADGYSRSKANAIPGICFATSGPGATNLLTGVASAFFDSVPLVVFTGQVARHRQRQDIRLRQFGFQEVAALDIFLPVVKASFKPNTGYELVSNLQEAWSIALDGRKGPVHIDLADDLQRDEIDVVESMYKPLVFEQPISYNCFSKPIDLFFSSRCPLFLVGNGCRDAADQLRSFLTNSNILCVSTWAAIDLVSGLDNYIGCIGTFSPHNNYILERSDLIVSIGCRLSNNIIGSLSSDFCPDIHKIVIDIDEHELNKLKALGVKKYIPVFSDVKSFLDMLSLRYLSDRKSHSKYYPVASLIERKLPSTYNSHLLLLESLFLMLINEGNLSAIFLDTGNNLAWSCNILGSLGIRTPPIFSSWNNTPMGFSVPAAVGFCLGIGRRPVMAVIGDGGLGICLSEIALVVGLSLPILIIVVENGGHNIQKQTIDTWLNSRYALTDQSTGLYLPRYENIEHFFGIRSIFLDGLFEATIDHFAWDYCSPLLVRVNIPASARSYPVVKFGHRLTDPTIQ